MSSVHKDNSTAAQNTQIVNKTHFWIVTNQNIILLKLLKRFQRSLSAEKDKCRHVDVFASMADVALLQTRWQWKVTTVLSLFHFKIEFKKKREKKIHFQKRNSASAVLRLSEGVEQQLAAIKSSATPCWCSKNVWITLDRWVDSQWWLWQWFFYL